MAGTSQSSSSSFQHVFRHSLVKHFGPWSTLGEDVHSSPAAWYLVPWYFWNSSGCSWWAAWASVEAFVGTEVLFTTSIFWVWGGEGEEHLLCAWVCARRALQPDCAQIIGIKDPDIKRMRFWYRDWSCIWTGIIPCWAKLLIYLVWDKKICSNIWFHLL